MLGSAWINEFTVQIGKPCRAARNISGMFSISDWLRNIIENISRCRLFFDSHFNTFVKKFSFCSCRRLVGHCVQLLKVRLKNLLSTSTCSESIPLEVKNSFISFIIIHYQTCHELTEKLVAYTVENGSKIKSQDGMKEIMASAKHIGPK